MKIIIVKTDNVIKKKNDQINKCPAQHGFYDFDLASDDSHDFAEVEKDSETPISGHNILC